MVLSSQDSIEKMNEAFQGDKGRLNRLASDLKYYDHQIEQSMSPGRTFWKTRRQRAITEYRKLLAKIEGGVK